MDNSSPSIIGEYSYNNSGLLPNIMVALRQTKFHTLNEAKATHCHRDSSIEYVFALKDHYLRSVPIVYKTFVNVH